MSRLRPPIFSPAYSDRDSRASARTAALAGALLSRLLTNIVFATWLIGRAPGWEDVFRVGSLYALVDGACALVTAVLVDAFARRDTARVLGALTIADGLSRIAAAIALRLLPGISGFPVTALAFFGVVGAATVTLGIGALGIWLYLRVGPGHARPRHVDGLLDPLVAAGLISFAVGYALILDPPATSEALRRLAFTGSVALSILMTVAFVGAVRRVIGRRSTDGRLSIAGPVRIRPVRGSRTFLARHRP